MKGRPVNAQDLSFRDFLNSTMSPPNGSIDSKKKRKVWRFGCQLRVASLLVVFLLVVSLAAVDSVESLVSCAQTSHAIAQSSETIDPCIVYYAGPFYVSGDNTAIVTIVQVTPSDCNNHRDGAPTAVSILNELNGGMGLKIGYNEDYYIQFRLVSVVAGNRLAEPDYASKHQTALRLVIETMQPQYILGTCTHVADLERDIAREYNTILMAQAGPPSFYSYRESRNEYLFGFHLSSDEYPKPALRSLRFYAQNSLQGVSNQPLRILYRIKSEFFRSTCESARDHAIELGFTDVRTYSFDPEDDDDEDGTKNAQDLDILMKLADAVCPPGSTADFYPAIFVCTDKEQQLLVDRWKQNGCRPSMLWITANTWADENLDEAPYFQSGGQWHPSFSYGDERFDNGMQFLDYQEELLGYRGNYDMVVSYSIVNLFAQHIQYSYRMKDSPSVTADFSDPSSYELFRRDLLVLRGDTLFGPFSLEVDQQQNSGRGCAGMQWLITGNKTTNECTAPVSEADTTILVPAPTAEMCDVGHFVSLSKLQSESSLLSSKCSPCPVNTFSSSPGNQTTCEPCPEGFSTNSQKGSPSCIIVDDNVLSRSLVSTAFVSVALVLSLGTAMLFWVMGHSDSAIIKRTKIFLIPIVCGAAISSASVITISFHEGTGADDYVASSGCQIAPFLYCFGWVLQLGGVAGLACPEPQLDDSRPKILALLRPRALFPLVAGLIIDALILSIWTLRSPLEYTRWTVSESIDLETGFSSLETVGFCTPTGDVSIWFFVSPLIFIHGTLLARTIVLFWRNRQHEDPDDQRRLSLLAALYAGQILLVGIPVVVAVGNNITARYGVMCGLIFCNDLGVMSIIFFPIRNREKASEEVEEVVPQLTKREQEKIERKKRREKEEERWRQMMQEMSASCSILSFAPSKQSEDCSPTPPLGESSSVNIQSIEQYDCTDAKNDNQMGTVA